MPIVPRQVSLSLPQGNFTGGFGTTNNVRLTDNRMVVVHNITGVTPDFYTRAFTIVDMADGLDTEIASPTITRTVGYLDKEPFQGNGVSVARLSDTRIVVSEPRSTGTIKLEIFDVSGTTITRVFNTSVLTNTNATNNLSNASHILIPLSATTFIQTFYNASNQSAYVVYRFTPAVVGPPAVAASLAVVRQFNDTESALGSDISWQQIPGSTSVMIVNRYVTTFFYAYQTYVWLVSDQGVSERARFTVDGEPKFLGPDRYVVSRWGRQDYFKKDGTTDGRCAFENYTGSTNDDNLYRPMILPINNDYHIQMRREFFQEQDSAMFMKVVRRDDTNQVTTSDWSSGLWYGKFIPSSTSIQRVTLPFDKRTPIVTGRNNLFWAGLWSGTYRWFMLQPTSALPVNPPAAPVAGPLRAATTRFTFNSSTLSNGVTVSGSTPQFLQMADSAIGTTGTIGSGGPANSANFSTNVTFTVPPGLTKAVIRYYYNSENSYDYESIVMDGVTVLPYVSGSNGGFQEASVTVSGRTTMVMTLASYSDGSVIRDPSGVFVSMVEFRPI